MLCRMQWTIQLTTCKNNLSIQPHKIWVTLNNCCDDNWIAFVTSFHKQPIVGCFYLPHSQSIRLKCMRITKIYRKCGSGNTMVTSDFTLKVERWPFCTCTIKIIIGTVRSLWTLLQGRCHVSQNVISSLQINLKISKKHTVQLDLWTVGLTPILLVCNK